MKHLLTIVAAFALVVMSASKCEKSDPGIYHDSNGKAINLIGSWGLTEVQYWTSGVVEKTSCVPESVMEFTKDGRVYTLALKADGPADTLAKWYYEKYRASVTLFTEEEYRNNRSLSDDDPQYEHGKTYYFKVIDENTMSYRDQIASGTYLVNILSRYFN